MELEMDNIVMKQKQNRSLNFISSDPTNLTTSIVNWRLTIRPNVWAPPTDVYETDLRFIVRVEIAGMNEEDFLVRVEQGRLLISGIRPVTPEARAFHRMEINYGEFYTEVELPEALNLNLVEAEYVNGFLLVTIPRAQPKHINID
jgi:HSP20 family protein